MWPIKVVTTQKCFALIVASATLMVVFALSKDEHAPDSANRRPARAISAGLDPGNELSPAMRLRKLSLHLRGIDPTRSEYQSLHALKGAGYDRTEAFFKAKTSEYLSSLHHISKMVERLTALFRLRPSYAAIDIEEIQKSAGTDPYASKYPLGAAESLFARIAAENLSWDEIVLTKNYRMEPNNFDSKDFFDLDSKQLVATPDPRYAATKRSFVSIEFDADDARIGGIVTTDRFLSRYSNSATNRNRRRAAAVFRVFLCDPMEAVITSNEADNKNLLDQAFAGSDLGETFHAMPITKPTAETEKRHGSDPSCMQCHYKLDPMAAAFRGFSSEQLYPYVNASALTYRSKSGELIHRPGRGIGDVLKSITEQRTYASCQVSHFARWFIGKDVYLPQQKINEWVEAFDRVGRRTNDFIAFLVSTPEFRNIPMNSGPQVMRFQKARQHLVSCSQCHKDNTEVPDFAVFPIGGSSESHVKWIDSIAAAVDLKGSGKAFMPPKSARWPSNALETAKKDLLEWICSGAPNERGEPTLNEDKAPEGLCVGVKK